MSIYHEWWKLWDLSLSSLHNTISFSPSDDISIHRANRVQLRVILSSVKYVANNQWQQAARVWSALDRRDVFNCCKRLPPSNKLNHIIHACIIRGVSGGKKGDTHESLKREKERKKERRRDYAMCSGKALSSSFPWERALRMCPSINLASARAISHKSHRRNHVKTCDNKSQFCFPHSHEANEAN